jgi:hypothetical protein
MSDLLRLCLALLLFGAAACSNSGDFLTPGAMPAAQGVPAEAPAAEAKPGSSYDPVGEKRSA